jgi:hypothetical protein
MFEAMGVGNFSCWIVTWTAVNPTTEARTIVRMSRFRRVRAASSLAEDGVTDSEAGSNMRAHHGFDHRVAIGQPTDETASSAENALSSIHVEPTR